jgi:Flp pilus assembly protein TadG
VTRARRTGWRQRGAVAVEFALVLPLMLLLVLGGVDWGYYFFCSQVAANAAREAARAGSLIRQAPGVNPCTTTTVGAQPVAINYLQRGALLGTYPGDARLKPFNCTVGNSCCTTTGSTTGFLDGAAIKVTIVYQAKPATGSMSLTGYLSTALLPSQVVASATMMREP